MSEAASLGDFGIKPTNLEGINKVVLDVVSDDETRMVRRRSDEQSGRAIYGGGGYHGPRSYDLGEMPFQSEVHIEVGGTVQALWLAKEGLEYQLSEEYLQQTKASMEHTYSSFSHAFHVPEEFPDIRGWQMGLEWKLIFVPSSATVTRMLYPEVYDAQPPGEDKISLVSRQLNEVMRQDPLVIVSPIIACDFLSDNAVRGDYFKMYGRYNSGEIVPAFVESHQEPGSQQFYFGEVGLMQAVADDLLRA